VKTPLTSAHIRQSFLDFFKDRGHTIVPSSSLMPDAPNLLFTNAGMNQFVPIFLGRQKCPYTPGRAADTQKCIRAGGKHNDLEDVGLDTYHHTFFEMLGNWSFGDYFKKEAIEWAWELLVGVWGFPPERLYATYFSGDDRTPADEEARALWRRFLPDDHIVPGGRRDNFWMMGDTGPCGPCSEIHVDLTPAGDSAGRLVNAGHPRCIEVWNLVFIQFNADADGSLSPLPARHVDTGMGFERICGIMQCTRGFTDFTGATSNYETDVFRPLFTRLEELSGRRYGGTLPGNGTPQENTDVAFRVIADHIRTVGFAIADGILPGNTDRNYVLRRILRRAVRYGRSLGFHQPFFHQLVDVLADTFGGVFPEIRARQAHVEEIIRLEEEAFNRTLDRGLELFHEEVERLRKAPASRPTSSHAVLAGDFAFKLYDTYGFPLDLTELMAREQGLAVDRAGFDRLMDQQRARARAAQKKEVIEISQVESAAPTRFVGYEKLEEKSRVADVLDIQSRTAVILDASPCYAEMGGQVGDTGELSDGGRLWRIADTRKAGDAWLHFLEGGESPAEGDEVVVAVDAVRRAAIQRHHTVTHLMHWALHQVLGPDATQKGSYVGPEKLTFDFSSGALTPGQIHDVERLVNERILENAGLSWTEAPFAEVRGRKDVMQFFGDKYGDRVRVVQIGGRPGQLDGYSMELCGGTHTRATGEIGLFRIVAESSVAAGIRRIEAVCGWPAYEKTRRERDVVHALATRFSTTPGELPGRVESLIEQARKLEKELKQRAAESARREADTLIARRRELAGIPVVAEVVSDQDFDGLKAMLDGLRPKLGSGLILLGSATGGKVHFVASLSDDLVQRGLHAGRIVGQVAKIAGGGGGGQPGRAQAGGKDPDKVAAAIAALPAILGAAP
jgi:alanyl-tRNA synthetase